MTQYDVKFTHTSILNKLKLQPLLDEMSLFSLPEFMLPFQIFKYKTDFNFFS